MLTLSLECFAQEEVAKTASDGSFSIYAGSLLSLPAEVEELDPFFGGGLAHQEEEVTEIDSDAFFTLYAGALLSLSAEVEELDPFFGGGFAYQQKEWRISFDYFEGEAKFSGYGIEVESDDTIYGFTVDYIFEPVTQNNPTYWGLGAGIWIEELEFEVETEFGDFQTDWSSEGISLEAIVGYKEENIDLFARLIFFPTSENVGVAAILGIGLTF